MSENKTLADLEAEKKAEIPKPNLLQRPTVIVLVFALVLIIGLALVKPAWDGLSLNSWVDRAKAEALALRPLLPAESFTAMEYSADGSAMVLYSFELRDSDPIPQRIEVGRALLPAGVRSGTFRDARSTAGGVLFARKVTMSGSELQWEGLYVSDAGAPGALEEYVLRDAGDGVYYVSNVPESLE